LTEVSYNLLDPLAFEPHASAIVQRERDLKPLGRIADLSKMLRQETAGKIHVVGL
jgi:hypothetical protein